MIKEAKENIIEVIDEVIKRAYETGDTEKIRIGTKVKNKEGFIYALAFNAFVIFYITYDRVVYPIKSGFKRLVSSLDKR